MVGSNTKSTLLGKLFCLLELTRPENVSSAESAGLWASEHQQYRQRRPNPRKLREDNAFTVKEVG